MSSVTVWKPGQGPLPAAPWKGTGRPTKYLRRNPRHAPVTLKDLALALPPQTWKKVGWREGTRHPLQSRFAAVRVRPAHRDFERSQPYPEQWLLIEWPSAEAEPTKYWFSTLPAATKLQDLVRMAKHKLPLTGFYCTTAPHLIRSPELNCPLKQWAGCSTIVMGSP